MKMKVMASAAVAGALVLVTAGAANAAPSEVETAPATVYEIAATANVSAEDDPVQPNAPVAVATALVRGFTAANAPRAVSQVLRQGSFPQAIGLLGAVSDVPGV